MSKKTNIITVRLNEEEYNILSNDSKNHNMTQSQYIRMLIKGVTPTGKNNNTDVLRLICRINIHLQGMGIQNEDIKKEMHDLCRMLSS